MRRKGLLAVVTVAAVTLATVSILLATDAQGPEPPTAAQTIEPRLSPELNASDSSMATAIARGALNRVGLPPASVASVETVPWVDDRGELIGAVVTLTLTAPRSVNAEWLGLEPEGRQPGRRYRTVPQPAHFDGVSAVRVFVDLNDQRIASVVPARSDTLRLRDSVDPSNPGGA